MSAISSFEGRSPQFLDYKNAQNEEFDFSFHISRPPEGSANSPFTFLDFSSVEASDVFSKPITMKELSEIIQQCNKKIIIVNYYII